MPDATFEALINNTAISLRVEVPIETLATWSTERYMALMEAIGQVTDVMMQPKVASLPPEPVAPARLTSEDRAEFIDWFAGWQEEHPTSSLGTLGPSVEALKDEASPPNDGLPGDDDITDDITDTDVAQLIEVLKANAGGFDGPSTLREIARCTVWSQSKARGACELAHATGLVELETTGRRITRVELTETGRG